MKSFGVGYLSSIAANQYVTTARQAEEANIDDFWIAESHYYRGAFSLAAQLAALTSRIKLGIGVVSPFSRHPVTIAMEAATLAEISKGRFTLGLGTSRKMILGLGVAASPLIGDKAPRVSPLQSMKETIEIIRRLFAGETVTFQGKIFRLQSPGAEAQGVRLGVDIKGRIPIYIGATGPKMLDLTGRIGDGVVLTLLTTPPFVKFAVSTIRQGANDVGRPASNIGITSYLLFSVCENRRRALDSVRAILARYVTRVEPNVLEKGGMTPQEIVHIESKLRDEGLPAAVKLIDDEMVGRFAVAGTPDDCLERLAEYNEAGLENPVALQILGPEPKRAIELIHSNILPELDLHKS